MEKVKAFFKFLLVAVLIAGVGGGYYFVTSEIKRETSVWNEKSWFRYSNDVDGNNYFDVEVKEIEKYTGKTNGFNQRVYYSKLTQNEKIVYHAFEYAYDNSYKYTFIPNELLAGSQYAAIDIMHLFSLDSLLIQQNINFDNYTTEYSFSKEVYRQVITKKIDGTIIGVDNFTKERKEKVQLALNELKKLDLGISDSSTDYEKISAIFDYVQNSLVYTEYVSKDSAGLGYVDFLYEAVENGKANCDGYAALFGVLCELNGVKCFDKMHLPDDDVMDKEVGHTWNVVSVDGVWYNADSTESLSPDADSLGFLKAVRLGFEDKYQTTEPTFKSLIPECNSNLISICGDFESFKSSDITQVLCSKIKESENDSIIFSVADYSDGDEDAVFDEVIEYFNSGIGWVKYTEDNYTMFCLYLED